MKLEKDLDFDNIDDQTLEVQGRQAVYTLLEDAAWEIMFRVQEEIERRRKAIASLVNFCNTGRFL